MKCPATVKMTLQLPTVREVEAWAEWWRAGLLGRGALWERVRAGEQLVSLALQHPAAVSLQPLVSAGLLAGTTVILSLLDRQVCPARRGHDRLPGVPGLAPLHSLGRAELALLLHRWPHSLLINLYSSG